MTMKEKLTQTCSIYQRPLIHPKCSWVLLELWQDLRHQTLPNLMTLLGKLSPSLSANSMSPPHRTLAETSPASTPIWANTWCLIRWVLIPEGFFRRWFLDYYYYCQPSCKEDRKQKKMRDKSVCVWFKILSFASNWKWKIYGLIMNHRLITSRHVIVLMLVKPTIIDVEGSGWFYSNRISQSFRCGRNQECEGY